MPMCKNGVHQLEIVYQEDEPFGTEYHYVEVVRWCENCGAIVVDREHDGRLISQSLKIHFPKILSEIKEEGK
jgi:hypothetical protein